MSAVCIGSVDKQPASVFLNDIGYSTTSRGNDRQTYRHSLQQHDGETLRMGGE